ncbi:AraC family transcriptional regulator [Fodinibius salsisoli]|uniref:Helix-turn-helix transcriptional regulator n=1 Tax=Fodinibius salsisoli TaxID=2820877 RepID=A0ABT3PRD3_9BACT|nr:AraC family transcriptional regulator [Fodinibius salsisoli]MCW9708424.1 helix-turn-helix transcriptional regulator [Fodinibius salsisoli]
MDQQHFHIKNMVCSHCAEVLEEKLREANFEVQHIELGELTLSHPLDTEEYERLLNVIRSNGFDLINDQGGRIVEQIKQLIIRQVRGDKDLEGNLSDYLSEHVHKDYQQLSRLFSSVEGKSIERYYILQKIERAKELIVYGEQNLTEIAYLLGYSSQQHFSRQFKKETGLAPSHFKEIKENKRISIDQL